MVRRARATTWRQLTIHPRGGARRGAGRKPRGQRALVPHKERASITGSVPVLVTLKVRTGLPSLRSASALACVRESLWRAKERGVVRVVHFSVQRDHVHMLVEARRAGELSNGIQGLAVSIAKQLNKLWDRRGTVFADRYHSRPLRTPRETRYALSYVLNNARKHGRRYHAIDPCSSGAAFDGWSRSPPASRREPTRDPPPVAPPRSWLLRVGWRKHGRIDWAEIPGKAA